MEFELTYFEDLREVFNYYITGANGMIKMRYFLSWIFYW